MKFLNYLLVIIFILSTQLSAHCQIPCGVYDDTMRIKMVEEHTLTILKSMNYIDANQGDLLNQNQVTRWIISKEQHAQEIQDIVSEYFLTQRIKLKDDSKENQDLYHAQLTALHNVMVDAMKCKQTTDTKNTTSLLENLDRFVNLYFDDHGKKHLMDVK
jgi:nickel superoxide dismutase|tara:strand:- start:868 stop:1344 length:477 start_codon:yes stop_codon:yes gene_type:complete